MIGWRIPAGAGDRLVHALRGALASFNGEVELEEISSQGWTSITFSGERHRLRLRLGGKGAGTAADSLLDRLRDCALELPGHILIDIEPVSDDRNDDGSQALLLLAAITVEAS